MADLKKSNFGACRAQTMMEYLLVMVVIAVLVFGAFSLNGGGIIDQTRQVANQYFNTGAMAIMGGYYDPNTDTYVEVNPQPINGEWCAWSNCVQGAQVRECACPRPAFGGNPCVGEAVQAPC